MPSETAFNGKATIYKVGNTYFSYHNVFKTHIQKKEELEDDKEIDFTLQYHDEFVIKLNRGSVKCSLRLSKWLPEVSLKI